MNECISVAVIKKIPGVAYNLQRFHQRSQRDSQREIMVEKQLELQLQC